MKKFILEVTLRNSKSCDDCPCCQNDTENNVWYCSAMDEAAVFKDIYRPNWCPLKEKEGHADSPPVAQRCGCSMKMSAMDPLAIESIKRKLGIAEEGTSKPFNWRYEWTDKDCPVCGEKQFKCPGGTSCENGHFKEDT